MISICIPIHDTPKTAFFLSRLLKSVSEQTYTDYEIVITKQGAFAENHNAAILEAKGEYVQMLQMDDYFRHPDALKIIVDGLDKGAKWQITACVHDYDGVIGNPHQPEWTNDILTGNNRLGSVSTLSFRRKNAEFFQKPLQWVVDCDVYYRYHREYGEPVINKDYGLVIDTRHDRLTHTISSIDKQKEIELLAQKYQTITFPESFLR